MKAPEVGPRAEGLRTGNEGNDPPPEDPGNAGRASQSSGLMDEMANYVASGWKQDLTYIIGCCWAAQVGSLD